MKVAYVLPYLHRASGWRSHSVAFIRAICEHVEPVLYVAESEVDIARRLFGSLEIIALPTTQGVSFSSLMGYKKLNACYWQILRGKFPPADLVHSMEAYPTGLVGSWLARKLRKPHAITTHGTYGVVWRERRWDRVAYERVLRGARLICPVSHGTARLMQQHFPQALRKAKIVPILNGNDFYKAVPREVAEGHQFPETPTIITVGDVKARKGMHLALEAFARLKTELPGARYDIIGHYQENAYYRRLQRMIAERNIQGVRFLGAIPDEDLHNAYRHASLFVLTPQQIGLHFEGFGLVYLEAGAYGLPVVATRSGGVPDAVKDGVTGLLAEPDDVTGIASAMLRLLTDQTLARRLGRGNRQWAETLTWESYAHEQYQAYTGVLHIKP